MSISLYFLFPKAGVDAVKGLIPGVNFVEWCKLIGRKPRYALLLLIPIVNIFIFTGMAVDLVRSFNKLRFRDTALAVIYAPAIFFKIAFNENDKYVEPILPAEKKYMEQLLAAQDSGNTYEYQKLMSKNPYKKPVWREWVESLVFAVFAAAFIRMFLIEAYVIPTPSMEGSLNVGDFLFVSKAHYGIRTPMTVAMIPLLHNRIPFINKESYIEKPALGYHRLPALESIEKGKPIVFNWPVGDSVYITPKRSYWIDQVNTDQKARQFGDRDLLQEIKKGNLVTRPLDKKDHYIKRCVATPGDSLQIIDRQIYINGKPQKNPTEMQFLYLISPPNGQSISKKRLDKWGINGEDIVGPNAYFLNAKQVEQLKGLGAVVKIVDNARSKGTVFPLGEQSSKEWTVDNYGPVWIPKKGTTIKLNKDNIGFYRRIINVYENNDYEEKNGQFFINGKQTDEYTFKQDYYWAMGDNRHNSEDSRMWGFVPHDHIVGKPLFIFFSKESGGGINWNRIMKSANIN